MTHATHPSAEVIYQELSPYYPTMSLTTVYNTLKALTEAGTIYTLKIERDNAHFDYPHYPHSHFRCRCCGEIFDVPLDENVLAKIDKKNLKKSASIFRRRIYGSQQIHLLRF